MNKSPTRPLPPFAREGATATAAYEAPVFETIEEFSVASDVYEQGTRVSMKLRRQLNYKPCRRLSGPDSGPYWLDLEVGSLHVPHWCVSEACAREAAARFLLEHVNGVVPTRH